MQSWKWIARYAVVLVVALLLGAAIAELTVFKQTTLGTPRLPASALARFLGYGGALIVFWILARRIALQLRNSECVRPVGLLMLPLASLIVLCAGYDVVLAILRPFLSAANKDVYNWMFVLSITACAIWLVASLYRRAEEIVDLLKTLRWSARTPGSTCQFCTSALPGHARFCAGCGKAVAGQATSGAMNRI